MPKVFIITLFVCVGILIYSNTFHNSFHLDDFNSIITNESIRDIASVGNIWKFWPTRFITYLSFAVNFHFHQFDVLGYHIGNLIIHICCAFLVWQMVLLTFRLPVMKNEKISKNSNAIAFFAGLIFLTHPLQTQGVTYIVQRAVSMVSLFYLGSLCLYIKSVLSLYEGDNSSVRGFYCSGVILAAVAAMFTKEIAVTFPLMILLYQKCFLKAEKDKISIPLVLLFVLFLIIPLTMLATESINFLYLRRLAEDTVNISPARYLFTQFRVILTYIRLLFVPMNQNLDYDYPVAKTLFEVPVLIGFFSLIAIGSITLMMFKKYRLISFGVFWVFLTVLPESIIIPINDVIFEHRLYLPMAGYSVFLVSLLFYVFKSNNRRLVYAILIVLVMGYSTLTYKRNFIWKDEISLWSDVISKSPKKARGYINRGLAYQMAGRFDSAMVDYEKVLELDPFHAGTYSNLGMIYLAKGDVDSSINRFNQALRINPALPGIYYNRGYAYQLKGDIHRSLADYNKAIELDPYYVDAYNNRGNLYLNSGNISQAIADYEKALEINPNYAPARYNIENVYKHKGISR